MLVLSEHIRHCFDLNKKLYGSGRLVAELKSFTCYCGKYMLRLGLSLVR